MIFLSISYFRNALLKLLKARRDEYKSIKHDITKILNGKKPEELFSYPDMIHQDKNFKIIKLRLLNSASKLSKKDGYRLIYVINNKKDLVCLFYTYPKRGSLGQIDISDNDLADYVEEYINKLGDKTLICHDITKELSINKKYLCNNETCIYEQTNCA